MWIIAVRAPDWHWFLGRMIQQPDSTERSLTFVLVLDKRALALMLNPTGSLGQAWMCSAENDAPLAMQACPTYLVYSICCLACLSGFPYLACCWALICSAVVASEWVLVLRRIAKVWVHPPSWIERTCSNPIHPVQDAGPSWIQRQILGPNQSPAFHHLRLEVSYPSSQNPYLEQALARGVAEHHADHVVARVAPDDFPVRTTVQMPAVAPPLL